MLHLVRRAGIALAVVVGAVLVGATPAAALVDPAPAGYACLDPEDSYGAPGVCQLIVLEAETVCRGEAPWLDYSLEPEGTPNTTATLVWGDPDGKHYTMENLPLSGSVLWPGAEVDEDGQAVDWPGWTLAPDGVTWLEGDEWGWVRPEVPLTFNVNSTAVITAYYPEAIAPCAGPPTTVVSAADSTAVSADDATPVSAVLSTTGSESLRLLLAAAGLLLAGGLILFVRTSLRRRASAR